MRQLRIVGVDTADELVRCELTDSGEVVGLPLDDELRAAAAGGPEDPDREAAGASSQAPAAGSASGPSAPARRPTAEQPTPAGRSTGSPRRGGTAAGGTGSMRPREIQDRIRHGASPEQVAADAGVPLSRIEGFAYPVVLERSAAAERGRGAHPVLHDGPSLATLEQTVQDAVEARGLDPEVLAWDAWKTKDGGWTVEAAWPAGLDEDATARWAFAPDSHGGTATPLDDAAREIQDPSWTPPVRGLPAPAAAGPSPTAPAPAAPATGIAPRADTPHGPPPVRSVRPPAPIELHSPARPRPVASPEPAASGTPDAGADAADAGDDFLQHPPTDPPKPATRRHPTVPSWEDVLLGARGKNTT